MMFWRTEKERDGYQVIEGCQPNARDAGRVASSHDECSVMEAHS